MSKKIYLLILTAFLLALFLCFPLEKNSVKTQKKELLRRASYTEAEKKERHRGEDRSLLPP